MATMAGRCPGCGAELAFPREVETVTCTTCGRLSEVIHFRGAMTLVPASGAVPGSQDRIDLIALLDEAISEVGSSIEETKSREVGAPLELGCAMFGVFGIVIIVLAIFSTVARQFFGGWVFYLVVAIVVLAAVMRIRQKVLSTTQRSELRAHRTELEAELASLETQRKRLLSRQQEELNDPFS